MNRFKLAIVLAGLALISKSNAQVSLNFNTPGDYLNSFNLYANTSGGLSLPPSDVRNPYKESLTAGVDGTGGISIVAAGANGTIPDSTSIYKLGSYDFGTVGSTLTISSMVKIGTTTETGNRLLQLGFVNEPTSGLNGNAGLAFTSLRFNPPNPAGGSVYTPQWQTKTAAGNTVNTAGTLNGGSANLSLTTGDWYQLSLTFENLGGGQIRGSGSMQDFGPNGTTPGTLATLDAITLTSADIASDASVWAAFRAFAADGAIALDSFAAVPEPGTISLLGLGGALALFAARRRK
jgi:hypothetical protein